MTTSHKLKFRSCQPKDILTIRTVNLFQYRTLESQITELKQKIEAQQ